MNQTTIPDVQGKPDTRHIAITRVGIRDIRIPLHVATPDGAQPTVATAEMTVALPHQQKGTHMSRFIHLLNEAGTISLDSFAALHAEMLKRLNATEGSIILTFPYFVKKQAPVSKTESLLDYEVTLIADGGVEDCIVSAEITIAVTSLCPCSKEISKYGAHNQRSHVTVTLTCHKQEVSIEEIIDLVENKASCQLYGLLKRPDEKYVTEHAYENPKFVEDMVRDIAVALKNDPRIDRFSVESENFESIHNHSAYALIEHP